MFTDNSRHIVTRSTKQFQMLCCFMRRMRLKERVLILLIGVTCCLVLTFLVVTTTTNAPTSSIINIEDSSLLTVDHFETDQLLQYDFVWSSKNLYSLLLFVAVHSIWVRRVMATVGSLNSHRQHHHHLHSSSRRSHTHNEDHCTK